MECILNELSLVGQYESVESFLYKGLQSLIGVIDDISNADSSLQVWKKSDLYTSKITGDLLLSDLIFSDKYRIHDILRKFKKQLANLVTSEPYWDLSTQQSDGCKYVRLLDKPYDVTGTTVAEAYVRNVYLVSFRESDYETELVRVTDGDTEKCIPNFYKEGQVIRFLYDNGQLPIAQYVINSFRNKLSFSEISSREGLNLIASENFVLFESAFKKFENLTWEQISVDDGLDYKEFSKNRNTKDYFKPEQWAKGIRKFRVNDKIRCFGYRAGNIFYILRIDLEHRLSDLG